jgi:hypothetical protein
MRVHGWAVGAATWVAALASAACTGTNPNQTPNPNQNQNQVKVSPMPYGVAYRGDAAPADWQSKGTSLDEVLAYVEGRPITRRRLIRESGGRPPELDDAAFERQLQDRLKTWVVEELFVRESERIGLALGEQDLDHIMVEQRARVVKEVSEQEGRPVTWAEYLTDRGITEGEWREMLRRQILRVRYTRRMWVGLGPLRPQVEMEVSPAEVKRIYRENPGEFDLKPAVKFAAFPLRFAKYLTADRPVAEAEAEMTATAARIAEALGRGEAPEDVARRENLSRDQNEWREFTDFVAADSELVRAGLGEEASAWLFAPERRRGDARVFSAGEDPLVLGVTEVQAARRRDWNEIREEIVKSVVFAREKRLEANLIIQMVAQRNIVSPQALADAIDRDARTILERLDKDPVFGAARFQ